jgi:hypothetical protein
VAEVSAAFLRAKTLQELMVRKVGGDHSVDAGEYEQVRRAFLRDPEMPPHLVPDLVKKNRDLDTLWTYAKDYHGSWEPRRRHVREEFGPLLDYLDRPQLAPADGSITSGLTRFDSEAVSEAWQRALQRRSSDPAAAITAARTMLESVLKNVLDDAAQPYGEADDLPKLYRQVSELLNLAPSQHTESIFKQVLGGCAAVVGGLGAVRNKVGDAHGTGRRPVKPAPRHAELVVNLAGAMALFIVQTAADRREAERAGGGG